MSELRVVALGPPAPGAAAPPEGLVSEWLSAEEIASAADLAALAARSALLWLPAWCRLAPDDWDDLARWLAAGRSAVARARLRLVGAHAAAPFGAAVVASRPGAASLRAGVPAASPGARAESLARPFAIAPPDSLSEHLGGVNRQTSHAVRLSEEAARAPSSLDLLGPFAALPLRVAGGSGPWRLRLAPAVLESYRAVLRSAKAWERRSARPRRP